MKLWGRDGRCKPYMFLLLRHLTVPYGAVNAHERVLERRHRADFSMLFHPVAMEPMKGTQFKTASFAMRCTISSLPPQTIVAAEKGMRVCLLVWHISRALQCCCAERYHAMVAAGSLSLFAAL